MIKDPVGGGSHGAVDTPGILSGSEARAFWISWSHQGAGLRFGRGDTVGETEVTSYPGFALPSVAAVSLSSGDDGGGAEWRLEPSLPLQSEPPCCLTSLGGIEMAAEARVCAEVFLLFC